MAEHWTAGEQRQALAAWSCRTGVGAFVAINFVVYYLKELGVGDTWLGWAMGLPAFANLAQFFGSWWAESTGRRKRQVVTVYRLATLSWLPGLVVGAWAAGVPERYPLAALAFMAGYLGNSVCFHLQNPAWEAWFSEAVPDRDKGRFFGRFGTTTGLVAGLVGLGGGLLVDRMRHAGSERAALLGFLMLFGLGAISGTAALVLLGRLRDIASPGLKGIANCELQIANGKLEGASAQGIPENPATADRDTLRTGTAQFAICNLQFAIRNAFQRLQRSHPSQLLRQALTQRNYLRFIAIYAWYQAVTAGYTAFMIAWFKSDLELGLAFLGVLTAIRTLTVAASSRFWGELVRRFGGKNLMALGLWNAVLFPLGLFLYTPENVGWLAPLHWAVSSILLGAFQVAINTLWYSLPGTEARTMQFALSYATYGVTGAVGPILGGYLVTRVGPLMLGDLSFSRYHWLFLLAALLQLVSLLLLRGLREKRSTPLRLVAAWLLRVRKR